MPRPPPSIRPVCRVRTARPRDHRPGSAARGYGAAWQKAAALHLAQNPLCARCAAHGLGTLATLVDHIHPVHGQADPRFFDPANHQSLCRPCHAVKTHADRRAGLTRKDG